MKKWTLGQVGKTNPKRTQTNPNEPKSCPPSVWRIKKAEMNVTSIITKAYENISNWAICENEPKTNPIKANLSRRSLRRSRNKPNLARHSVWQGLPAISVAGQRQKMTAAATKRKTWKTKAEYSTIVM